MKTRTHTPDELTQYLDSAETRALDKHRRDSVYPSNYAPSIWELNLPNWPENFDYAYLGHRDADHLDLSNGAVMRSTLRNASETTGYRDCIEPDDPEAEDLDTVTFSRSSCSIFGWFDKAVVVVLLPCEPEHPHRASADAVKACGLDPDKPHRYSRAFLELSALRDALESYPVLDEDDFSRREWEAKMEELEASVRRARVTGTLDWQALMEWLDLHDRTWAERDGYLEREVAERAAIACGMEPDDDLQAELLGDWDISIERNGRYYDCLVQGNRVTRRRGPANAGRWLNEQTRRVARLYSNGTNGPHAGG